MAGREKCLTRRCCSPLKSAAGRSLRRAANRGVRQVVMRNFIGQITCGGPPTIAIFGAIYFALMNIQSDSEFWSKQVRTFEAWDYFVLGSVLLAFLAYATLALIGTSFVWLRAASKMLGPEEAKRIYHRTYRTPNHGYGRKWNIRFVDWVLKDA